MEIQSLHYYPVKSCGAVNTPKLRLDERGPLWDRHWMVVDANGHFVTQRQLPELCLVQPSVHEDGLTLTGPTGALKLLHDVPRKLRRVEVWGDEVTAEDEGEEAKNWFSNQFGQELSLVRYSGERRKDDNRSVRFPDSYPILVCNEASLEELNGRLAEPVEMARFRPNIVIKGAPAFAEDKWRAIRLGNHEFPIGKPCGRCSLITVDPSSGKKTPEPLATLATFRKSGKSVEFGQYLFSVDGAELEVGMKAFPIP